MHARLHANACTPTRARQRVQAAADSDGADFLLKDDGNDIDLRCAGGGGMLQRGGEAAWS